MLYITKKQWLNIKPGTIFDSKNGSTFVGHYDNIKDPSKAFILPLKVFTDNPEYFENINDIKYPKLGQKYWFIRSTCHGYSDCEKTMVNDIEDTENLRKFNFFKSKRDLGWFKYIASDLEEKRKSDFDDMMVYFKFVL